MSNVIDNLVKMKHLTEMMVSLAYSDLFYDEIHLQKELEEIHLEIKELEKENLKHIFRIREREDMRISIIELMEYIKDITHACSNIAALNSKGRILPFPDTMLNESDDRSIIVSVSKKSTLCSKKVGDMKIRTLMKVNINGIKRNKRWIFNINKDTIIRADDIIWAVCGGEGKKIFTKIADGTLKSVY